MPKRKKHRTYQEKIGLPPGTLIHLGEERTEKCKITVFRYDEEKYEELILSSLEELFALPSFSGVSWINIDGVHQTALIQSLGSHFQIHPLALEDIVNTGQRPKVEEFDGLLLIVLKMIYQKKDSKDLVFEQVSLVAGAEFVISFQEWEGDIFDPIRNRIRNGKGKIRKMGADYLAYTLMDTLVDHYFAITEYFVETMENLEEEMLANPSEALSQKVHELKRELLYFRRWASPVREVVLSLQREETEQIQDTTRIYLRDVYDHLLQVIDSIENCRESLAGIQEAYSNYTAHRMNQVMKMLAMIATLFMPLTFIAGIYGMNFHDMPELRWKFGYPLALLVMAVAVLGMLAYFKKKKWF